MTNQESFFSHAYLYIRDFGHLYIFQASEVPVTVHR